MKIGTVYRVMKTHYKPSDFVAYTQGEEYEIASKPDKGIVKIKRGNRVREINVASLIDAENWQSLS